MNPTVALIIQVAFFILIAFFAIISALAMYVFIRYGRTRAITLSISLVFTIVFILGSISAFAFLNNLL